MPSDRSSLVEVEEQSRKPTAFQNGLRRWGSRFRSYCILDPLIFLYTFGCGTASLVASFNDPTGEKQHAWARTWSRWILSTAMCPVKVIGLDRIDASRTAIYAVNHI